MAAVEAEREKFLQDYRKKLLEHKEVESRLKESKFYVKCQVIVAYFDMLMLCHLFLLDLLLLITCFSAGSA